MSLTLQFNIPCILHETFPGLSVEFTLKFAVIMDTINRMHKTQINFINGFYQKMWDDCWGTNRRSTIVFTKQKVVPHFLRLQPFATR